MDRYLTSITGMFGALASAFGVNMREQIVAGSATQKLSCQEHVRLFLKRIGGSTEAGRLSPAWCPAHPRPQAGSRQRRGEPRFGA